MQPEEYIVNAGPQGTFNKSGDYQTLPQHIDAMFERYEQKRQQIPAGEPMKLVLYFHGGLVNEKRGMNSAAFIIDYLSQSNRDAACFVWETGLVETVANNISKISQTKLFNKLLKALLKELAGKLGFEADMLARGGNGLTDAEIAKELSKEKPFEDYNPQVPHTERSGIVPLTALSNDAVLKTKLEADFEDMVEHDYEFRSAVQETKLSVLANGNAARGIITTAAVIKRMVAIAFRVIKRFTKKRDHGFYPTIIEEILREFYVAEVGAWVWNAMKVKANDMWKSNGRKPGDPYSSSLDQYAGRYFLDKLMDFVAKYKDTQVSLVGHSAGSIAICNLLKHAARDYPAFRFRNIIFFAPAVRTDLFCSEIVKHPERYEQFRIFTMTDENECNDNLVPYFYTRSLLYLISGILEEEGEAFDAHLLGLHRHIGGNAPYDSDAVLKDIKTFLDKDKNHLILSVADGGDGLNSDALKHGDFDNNVLTCTSMSFMLN